MSTNAPFACAPLAPSRFSLAGTAACVLTASKGCRPAPYAGRSLAATWSFPSSRRKTTFRRTEGLVLLLVAWSPSARWPACALAQQGRVRANQLHLHRQGQARKQRACNLLIAFKVFDVGSRLESQCAIDWQPKHSHSCCDHRLRPWN